MGAALITSALLVVAALLGVLLPVLALIGAADGPTAAVLDGAVGSIAVAVVVGFSLVAALLLFRIRSGATAWVLGVAAVASALLLSLWPLVAVALAGVDQMEDAARPLRRLIGRVLQR